MTRRSQRFAQSGSGLFPIRTILDMQDLKIHNAIVLRPEDPPDAKIVPAHHTAPCYSGRAIPDVANKMPQIGLCPLAQSAQHLTGDGRHR